MYTFYDRYTNLVAIENTYSKDSAVADTFHKGASPLFSFTVFLASSLDRKYIMNHNNYLTQSTVHFVFWCSLVQRQF